MTVIALHRPAPAPKPPPVDTHAVIPAAARNAMTELEGKVGQLRRIFAGPSAPIAQIARIEALANEIRTEGGRVARFVK